VKMRKKYCKSSCGFTLIELTLSAALIGIMSASLALIFTTSLDLVNSSDERNELVQEGRNGMNRIVTELKHASEISCIQTDFLSFDTTYLSEGSTETKNIGYWFYDNEVLRSVNYGDWNPFIDDITSFQVGGITLWTTLDDELSIASPRLGPDGMLEGAGQFAPMKFNSGFYSGSDWPYAKAVFPASGVLYNDRGTIEFWYTPYYSIDDPNGTFSKWLIAVSFDEIHCLAVYYDFNKEKLIFKIMFDGAHEVSWKPDWEVGSLVHIAVVWDSTGEDIGEGQIMALFVDGIERGDAPHKIGWMHGIMFTPCLVIGADSVTSPAQGTFDNLKVYDYCKTNFDDRNREDAVGVITIDMRLDNGSDEITMRDAANVR